MTSVPIAWWQQPAVLDVLKRPPQSPDLNLAERLWDVVEWELYHGCA